LFFDKTGLDFPVSEFPSANQALPHHERGRKGRVEWVGSGRFAIHPVHPVNPVGGSSRSIKALFSSLRYLRFLGVEKFSPVQDEKKPKSGRNVHRLVGSGQLAIHPVHPVRAWLLHGYRPETEKRKKERKRNGKGTKKNTKEQKRTQ
jgi:hypothetical protein